MPIIMKKSVPAGAVAVLSLSLVVAGLFFLSSRDNAYPIEKTVQYGFTLSNNTDQPVNTSDVYVYAPLKETPLQKTLSITANLPYELVEGKAGNQMLRFRLTDLPPYGSKVISIRARTAFSESPVSAGFSLFNFLFDHENLETYAGPAPFVETGHPLLKKQAGRLKQSSALETARATYGWVAHSLTDKGYIEQDRGALHAYQSGVGDCTEFMYLYMALTRINGIASRGVGGFIVNDNSVLDPRNYHNWSQSYLDGSWRNVDPNRKVFLEKESRYLGFRVLEDQPEESAKGLSQSLAFVGQETAGKIDIVMIKGV